jgi:hypothetical protein
LQQSGNKKPSGFFEPEGFAWNPLPKIAFVWNPMPVDLAGQFLNIFLLT